MSRVSCHLPSKHAGSDLHLIRISSEALARSMPDSSWYLVRCLASGPDLFSGKPDTARTKLDPGWFCTVWSGLSVEECNRVWKWKCETGNRPITFSHNQAWLHLARPSRWTLAHFAQYDMGLLWKNGTKLEEGSWMWHIWYIYIYTIQPDSDCMLAVMAITGHNQNASKSDLACLLGMHQYVCAAW